MKKVSDYQILTLSHSKKLKDRGNWALVSLKNDFLWLFYIASGQGKDFPYRKLKHLLSLFPSVALTFKIFISTKKYYTNTKHNY